MNISRSQRRKEAKKQELQLPVNFERIDLSSVSFIPEGMTRAYRNNRFTVMIYDDVATTKGPAIQVLIQSHLDKPIERHWSTIQQIKNEIFGEETMAIEYYPAESDLVDLHNIYWIWIFPDNVLPKRIREHN